METMFGVDPAKRTASSTSSRSTLTREYSCSIGSSTGEQNLMFDAYPMPDSPGNILGRIPTNHQQVLAAAHKTTARSGAEDHEDEGLDYININEEKNYYDSNYVCVNGNYTCANSKPKPKDKSKALTTKANVGHIYQDNSLKGGGIKLFGGLETDQQIQDRLRRKYINQVAKARKQKIIVPNVYATSSNVIFDNHTQTTQIRLISQAQQTQQIQQQTKQQTQYKQQQKSIKNLNIPKKWCALDAAQPHKFAKTTFNTPIATGRFGQAQRQLRQLQQHARTNGGLANAAVDSNARKYRSTNTSLKRTRKNSPAGCCPPLDLTGVLDQVAKELEEQKYYEEENIIPFEEDPLNILLENGELEIE